MDFALFKGNEKKVREKVPGTICRNGPKAGTDAKRWSSHKWCLAPFPTFFPSKPT
jgi:hypothetical protein